LLGAILGTQLIAALIAGLGILVSAIPWSYVGAIWLYCLVWVVIEDRAKLVIYSHFQQGADRHRRFLGTAARHLHGHGQ
jgi:H+-transporting ATPase